ncbi:MAG: nitric oxide reductase NorQ protein [Verrucomicrobiales bacterium]|jgi:nitric oxide reductase NorQ protein
MSEPIYYVETGKETQVFAAAHQAQLPVLLKGPTGCGKTRFVRHMAERLGLQLITVSCNEDTSATDLLGRHLLLGGETKWTDGPVTRALREGAMLYLDEIAEARSDAIVAIHSITDDRRELFLDRTGETLQAGPDFICVGSYNPGYQRSMKELKPSTRQRFVGLNFGFPQADVEIEIVCHESGVDEKTARALVGIADKSRGLTELALLESVSTRLLVDAGKLIAGGLPPRLASHAAIAEPITDDPDALIAIKQVIDLHL